MTAPPTALALRLQDVTEALAWANTEEAVFDVILHPAVEALQASAATVLLATEHGNALRLGATVGYADGAATVWQGALTDDDGPAADAITRRTPLYFEEDRELARRYPNVERRTGATAPVAATAVLPMYLDQQPLGVLVIDFLEPHTFSEDERRFMRTLAAQCAIGFGRARLLTGLNGQVAAQSARLAAQRARADTLAALGDALQSARRPGDVGHLALPLLGDILKARTAMVVMLEQGVLRAPTVWGKVWPGMAAFLDGGIPLAGAALLAACARTGEAGYYAEYSAAGGGVAGLPPMAFAVEPIRIPGGALAGLLAVWRSPAGDWRDGERDLLRRAAGTLGLALERAAAEQELNARTAALDAFVAFTEAVGTETDVLALARQAVTLLRTRFQDGSIAYYTRRDDRWVAQVWSEDLTGPLLDHLRSGLPGSTPVIERALQAGGAVFTDAWDPDREGIPHTGSYGAAAATPLIVNGKADHLMIFGLRNTHHWTERDRALVRAVGRGLTLALDRAEAARFLRSQNEELEARTRALEAFAELSRDLTQSNGPAALIDRALTMVQSLLPRSLALYYQKSGGHWHATAQVGAPVSPALQAVIDAGFPVGEAPVLDEPDRTGQPLFHERLGDAPAPTPEPPGLFRQVQAVATLPVLVRGEVAGAFNVTLFEARRWNAADRAVLETTVRSLGLALEGREGVVQLLEERRKLEDANEELEAFAYSVSHDLRTPVRHIIGFNELLRRQLGDGLNPRAARHLTVIEDAARRMNTLIDAMLDMSRTSRLPLKVTPVNLRAVVEQVRQDLRPEGQGRAVTWTVGELPVVMGDADTLRQVVLNLLSNALKYTRARDAAVIEVWAENRPDEWAVFVRDNGAGFDPRYATKLFGVFQRLHRYDEFEGVGVGLANVRRIIHRHGGQVTAMGVPGAGATFGFTLPKR
ncbi:GAF domain-containing protein (plasmid) [Deinococcus taeanensis]|uniref:GAF domain-containing protein n=1 Tax=Deinococcus taeanensis TaxID=2737050 RepID=UPI001CDB920F|nr:GAF domain-containing protein [Deinococcus taeanensis]UBV44183.1 GAF domain-containing protein [Deinococcus taeanensis]